MYIKKVKKEIKMHYTYPFIVQTLLNISRTLTLLPVAPQPRSALWGAWSPCGLSARFCPRPRRTPEHSSESTGDDLWGHSGAAPALGCGIRHTALFEGALGEPTWFAAHACVVSATAKSLIVWRFMFTYLFFYERAASMKTRKTFRHGIYHVNAVNRYPSKTDGTQTDIP